jgi:hypothetical protein
MQCPCQLRNHGELGAPSAAYISTTNCRASFSNPLLGRRRPKFGIDERALRRKIIYSEFVIGCLLAKAFPIWRLQYRTSRWRPAADRAPCSQFIGVGGLTGFPTNRFKHRRVCFPAAAELVRVENVDHRPRQLSRSPRRLFWQPISPSLQPQVERGVQVKDLISSLLFWRPVFSPEPVVPEISYRAVRTTWHQPGGLQWSEQPISWQPSRPLQPPLPEVSALIWRAFLARLADVSRGV